MHSLCHKPKGKGVNLRQMNGRDDKRIQDCVRRGAGFGWVMHTAIEKIESMNLGEEDVLGIYCSSPHISRNQGHSFETINL